MNVQRPVTTMPGAPYPEGEMTMGTVSVHEFMTLDGVIENPSWTFDYPFDMKMGDAIATVMGACKTILLGRKTYELFAPTWSTRTAADDPGAPFMNDTTKYVVSSTLTSPDWRNSTVLGPYSAEAIRGLKERVDGGIYVSGSGTLVRAMVADGLVDDLHLFVFPLALGGGPRLFPEGVGATKFELAGCKVYDNGALYLHYRTAQPASGA
jgi:dihydrofolate reductase